MKYSVSNVVRSLRCGHRLAAAVATVGLGGGGWGMGVGGIASAQISACASPFLSYSDFKKDADLGVGRSQIVAIDHDLIKVFDKCGGLLFESNMDDANGFWATAGTGSGQLVGDPEVVHDLSTNRFWAMAQANSDPADRFFVAYSNPEDGGSIDKWHRFRIDFPASVVPGYEHPEFAASVDSINIAVDESSVWLSMLVFTDQLDQSYVFVRIDKAALMSGSFDPDDDVVWYEAPLLYLDGSLALCENYSFSSTAPQYAIMTPSAETGELWMYELSLDPAGQFNPIEPTRRDLAIATPVYAVERKVDQPGGQPTASPFDFYDISPNAERIWNAVYRNGHVWACHMSGDTATEPTRNLIRWYEIDPSSLSQPIVQQGLIDPPLTPGFLCAFAPSIAVDASNNAAIAYGVFGSGAGQYVSIHRSSRCANDPPNDMPTSSIIRQGTALVGTCCDGPGLSEFVQFGDYSGCVPDRVVPNRFYCHVGEGRPNDDGDQIRGRTWIGRFDGLCGLDFSGDGGLDAEDTAIFLQALAIGNEEADLATSGTIDAEDIAAHATLSQPK